MTTVMTGSGGFLGWHTRVALREQGETVDGIPVGDRFDLDAATSAVSGAKLVLHLAGVNRAPEDEVVAGNIRFAEQLAAAVERAPVPPSRIVYAGSVQSERGTAYGDAKAAAGERLTTAANAVGAQFAEIRLPNLFGEHGRPFSNSVTATFCHQLVHGGEPEVLHDRELGLLHAQDAADLLLGSARQPGAELVTSISVSGLLERLTSIASTYRTGDIPDLSTRFGRNLFNTYRSHAMERHPHFALDPKADERGTFFEVIRAHGGPGQFSFSTTQPGVTRGDHFHRRKVERFTVLSGSAVIALRRVFSDEIVELPVDGEQPIAVDMPTMWAHNIRNTGSSPLLTSFWTDDIFDPASPDTIPERV